MCSADTTNKLMEIHTHARARTCSVFSSQPNRNLTRSQGTITDMVEERVVQPLLVTSSALTLATECVRMILKVTRAPGIVGT